MTFISDGAQKHRMPGKYILPLIISFILQQKLISVNLIWYYNDEKGRFRRFSYFLCLKEAELRSAGENESKTGSRRELFASSFKRLCIPNYANLQFFKKTVAFCDFI